MQKLVFCYDHPDPLFTFEYTSKEDFLQYIKDNTKDVLVQLTARQATYPDVILFGEGHIPSAITIMTLEEWFEENKKENPHATKANS